MLTLVSKEMTFDAAHMLTGYDGDCQNLHGHTYRVVVRVAEKMGYYRTNLCDSIVMDFSQLKNYLDGVITKFDHAYLYNLALDANSLEVAIATTLERENRKTLAMPFPVTAENIAFYIYKQLSANVQIHSVSVWETPTSCATYGPDEGRQ